MVFPFDRGFFVTGGEVNDILCCFLQSRGELSRTQSTVFKIGMCFHSYTLLTLAYRSSVARPRASGVVHRGRQTSQLALQFVFRGVALLNINTSGMISKRIKHWGKNNFEGSAEFSVTIFLVVPPSVHLRFAARTIFVWTQRNLHVETRGKQRPHFFQTVYIKRSFNRNILNFRNIYRYILSYKRYKSAINV